MELNSNRMGLPQVVDVDSITLEMLQQHYNVPLAELAKDLGLSLTLLKKICRKFGIQRWPHRQIRSINKTAQELRERMVRSTTQHERDDIQVQLELLEKKKRLVTRGASSGLQSTLRNALFLANPKELDEDLLLQPENIPQLKKEFVETKPKGPNNNSLLSLMMKMRQAGDEQQQMCQAPAPQPPQQHMFGGIGGRGPVLSALQVQQQLVMQQQQLNQMALQQQMMSSMNSMNYLYAQAAPAPVMNTGFQGFMPYGQSFGGDMGCMAAEVQAPAFEMDNNLSMMDDSMDMVDHSLLNATEDSAFDAEFMSMMNGLVNPTDMGVPAQQIPQLRTGTSFEDFSYAYQMPTNQFGGYAM